MKLLSAVALMLLPLAALAQAEPWLPVQLQEKPAPKPEEEEPDEPEREEGAESWLADAELALETGRYRSARAEFRKVLREVPTHQVAARGLAETLAAESEYKDAIKTLEKVISEAGTERQTWAALGRLRLILSDFAGAASCAAELFKADADDIDGVALMAWAQHGQGLYEEALATAERVRAISQARRGQQWRVERGKRQRDVAEAWTAAGECYFILNRLHDANTCWDNAYQADNYHVRANAWLMRLNTEQPSNVANAVGKYAEPMLQRNPYLADFHFWSAQAYFAQWRGGQGLASLEQALKVAPDHHMALPYRAQRLVSNDDYEGGKRDYTRALRLNPRNMEALGAKALHGKTLGLDELYNEAEKAALEANPKPARFYEIVADGLSERFRYFEALPLYDKAIECNPRHWTAFTGRGRAALNKGDDKLGKASLEVALENDPIRNNLQTRNLLTLLDSYKNFDRYESPDGRWKLIVHKSEAAVMRDIYLEHLNTAWERLEKKYNFKPRVPLSIEAFHIHADFEVRTVGITGLPALGACFGQLVTLDSPSARPPGTYNWASTLRHEMDHVWQIQLSNGQVPRWLAEGLSVYEEKTTRPEWERHMVDQLFQRYHMDDIPPIKRFNEWFRDGSKILFAYYLGNVMIEFIDKKLGGMGAVRKMLEMFGQKKTPEEVFKACLGIEPEEYDRRFREYVRDERIAHLRMVKLVSAERVKQLYYAYEDGKATRRQLVDLALGYAQQGSAVDARMFLGMARGQGADKAEGEEGALWHYAAAMLTAGSPDIAADQRAVARRMHLEAALARGLEDFGTFMTMAGIARQEQNTEAMVSWLERARAAFPESPAPHATLYQHWLSAGDRARAIESAEAWMRLDENNVGVRNWLIDNVYEPAGNWEKVADMSLQVIFVTPLETKPHNQRALALRRLKQYGEAVKHFEYVRRLAKGTLDEVKAAEAAALLDIAATWMHAGDKEKCRQYIEMARKLEPANPRIAAIEEELEGDAEE